MVYYCKVTRCQEVERDHFKGGMCQRCHVARKGECRIRSNRKSLRRLDGAKQDPGFIRRTFLGFHPVAHLVWPKRYPSKHGFIAEYMHEQAFACQREPTLSHLSSPGYTPVGVFRKCTPSDTEGCVSHEATYFGILETRGIAPDLFFGAGTAAYLLFVGAR
jgi:hypothetical protein